jgi:major intracellular serine protease
MKKNKIDCGLLPHTTENIYGLNSSSAQIYGWEIKKFNIEKEWTFSQGEGIKIAVIDTGCDVYHPDLKNNLLQGKNFISKNDPIDDNGHGTHVSGTIAAQNNNTGIVGVAPQSKIIPIKALNGDGNGNNNTIAKAIIWATDNNANFITMSLGSPYDSSDIKSAINYANRKGCVVFCAAGNSGPNTEIMYPARYSNTVAIGSIGQQLNRSRFTCAGEELDFLSPGENILSCMPNNNYAIMSGTSMANPFAVGCAALAASYAKKIKNNSLKTYVDYINLFKQNTLKLKDKKFNNQKKYEGYGIIQPSCSQLK